MTGELLAFVSLAVVVIVTPGPDTALTIRNTMAGGRAAGLGTAVGVCSGQAVWTVAAAAGVAALLVASEPAFLALKYAGAAYLVFLGIRALLDRSAVDPALPAVPPRDGRTFRQAFTVGISNPKVAVFFLAFLPQFVRPEAGPATVQVLLLGTIFLLVALALDLGWAMLAGALAGWLRRHPALVRRQRFGTGPVYLGLGAYAAVVGGEAR
jgi:threonine/homoserine/homoserine lactone efflux protein